MQIYRKSEVDENNSECSITKALDGGENG